MSDSIDIRITFDRPLTAPRDYTARVFAEQLDELLTGRKALPRADTWGMHKSMVASVAPVTASSDVYAAVCDVIDAAKDSVEDTDVYARRVFDVLGVDVESEVAS